MAKKLSQFTTGLNEHSDSGSKYHDEWCQNCGALVAVKNNEPSGQSACPECGRSGRVISIHDIPFPGRAMAIRQFNGLNQTEMSIAMGVHRQTWGKWERGEQRIPNVARHFMCFAHDEDLFDRLLIE